MVAEQECWVLVESVEATAAPLACSGLGDSLPACEVAGGNMVAEKGCWVPAESV